MKDFSKIKMIALVSAMGAWGGMVQGQNYTYLYRFATSDTGGSSTTTSQLRYDVRPHSRTESMFPGQTSSERWYSLITSGYVMGGHKSTLTRGIDFVEDWDINFIDPANPSNTYWGDFYSDRQTGSVSRSGYPDTLSTGPQTGQSLLTSNNLIAMGDDHSLWYDSDGTLSRYSFGSGGSLTNDYTWTSFSGGAWNGLTLASKLNLFIGYEESNLYFLEGDSTVYRFSLSGVLENTYQVVLDGELSGRTLGDLVDGKIDGYTYLGWDVGPIVIGMDISPVPEQSSLPIFFGGCAIVMTVASRRKRIGMFRR